MNNTIQGDTILDELILHLILTKLLKKLLFIKNPKIKRKKKTGGGYKSNQACIHLLTLV